jgi:ABC-type polysaccharide/polyol phosphate export permease
MKELQTLYRHRQLISALTARDLKARYRGSVLGYFWSLANPLLLLGVYTLVFTFFFPSNKVQPYSLFLFTGILPWTFFAAAVLESTTSVISNAGLIKKVLFPAEALPLVVVTSHLVHFVLALPILLLADIAFAIHGDVAIHSTLALVPFVMLLQTLFVAGIAVCVASASVLFRDLRDILTNLIQLGFFITPILYQIDTITSRPLRGLLRLNPMTPFIVTYQDLIFFGHLPGLADTFLMIAYAFVSMISGFVVFDRLRDVLAEAI